MSKQKPKELLSHTEMEAQTQQRFLSVFSTKESLRSNPVSGTEQVFNMYLLNKMN